MAEHDIFVPSPEIQKLQNTIRDLHRISKTGFEEILATAHLILKWLENPESHCHPNIVAYALSAIRDKADEANNNAHCVAKKADCQHIDSAEQRRIHAWIKAKKLRKRLSA